MKYCILLIISLLQLSVFGQTKIVLQDINQSLIIGKSVEILIDNTNQLTFKQIISHKNLNKFKKSEQEIPNYSFNKSHIWCKIEIENKTQETEWQLKISNPVIDTLIFYSPQNNGEYLGFETGYYLPFKQRQIQSANFIFNIKLGHNEKKIFFLMLKTEKSFNFPLEISTKKMMFERKQTNYILDGIYFGLIIIMVLYNLLVFFSTHDKNYLIYVLYTLFIGLTIADLKGYAFEYLWPALPKINPFLPVIGALSGGFAMFFSAKFLKTKTSLPILHNFFVGLIALFFVSFVLAIFRETTYAVLLSFVASVFGSILALLAGLILLKKKYRPAKFFLIAWIWFIVGLMVYILADMQLIAFNQITKNSD